ncbi:MAG: ECF transporter S component [Bacillota bacterium]|nr:ECF transporter S component [Bacillota bacterium]
MKTNVSQRTAMMVRLALLAAVSLALVLVTQIPFPPAPFLKYDAADIPILLTAFAFGPAAAMAITLVVSFVQAFFLGGDGLIGFCMHIISTGTFVLVAGLIYKKQKTRKGAVAALIAGALTMTASMLLWNYIVTPFYMGVDRAYVMTLLVPVFLPFNLLKAAINAGVTFLIYKPLSPYLHGEAGARVRTKA